MTRAHTYSEEVADMDIHSVLATLPYSIKAYVVANPQDKTEAVAAAVCSMGCSVLRAEPEILPA